METQNGAIESVTMSDILELATWNRQRSTDELTGFIASKHAALPEGDEIA